MWEEQDAQNKSSPLIRALAIRTMGCLRVSSFNDYLIDSLKKTLSDSDPYVRKTAVLCVPKFYELTPKLVEEKGLIEIMTKLLKSENNPSVLTNLVVSLQEISILSGKKLIVMEQSLLKKVLTCVNEAIGTISFENSFKRGHVEQNGDKFRFWTSSTSTSQPTQRRPKTSSINFSHGFPM